MRWSGYAELWFVDNAHMALAHAVEQTGTDLFAEQPDAWLVEDRRIVWHAEGAVGRAAMDTARRFIDALAAAASRGEAFIEAAALGRWTRHAGPPAKEASDPPDLETPPPMAVRSQREPASSDGHPEERADGRSEERADGRSDEPSEDSQDSGDDSRPTIPMAAPRRRHDDRRVDRWSAPISERRHAHQGRSRSRRP